MKTFKEFSEAIMQTNVPKPVDPDDNLRHSFVQKPLPPQITGKQVGSFINGADAKTIQQIQNACATRLKQLNPQPAPQKQAAPQPAAPAQPAPQQKAAV